MILSSAGLIGPGLAVVPAVVGDAPPAVAALNTQESVGVDSCGAGNWSAAQGQGTALWNHPLARDNYEPRTIGGYIGGPNNPSCALITSAWAESFSLGLPGGWGIVPIYQGRFAPAGCGGPSGEDMSSNINTALSQGESDAYQAVVLAETAGFDDVIYDDMEYYDPNAVVGGLYCWQIVDGYLNGWVAAVQRQYGFASGVYGSASSTIWGLANVAGNPDQNEPDYIWSAGSTESPWNIGYGIPNSDWVYDQRDVQYCQAVSNPYPCMAAWLNYDGMTYDTDCVLAAAEGGLSASVWDADGYNDGNGGIGESYSPSDDNWC